MYLAYLAVALLTGLAAFLIAKEKGHDPVKWFFIGAVTSFAGLAVIALIKKKVDAKKSEKKPS